MNNRERAATPHNNRGGRTDLPCRWLLQYPDWQSASSMPARTQLILSTDTLAPGLHSLRKLGQGPEQYQQSNGQAQMSKLRRFNTGPVYRSRSRVALRALRLRHNL